MAERLKTGIIELDKMLSGGLHPGTVTIVKGAPGTGKSALALEFIARGIEQFAEPGLIVTFEHFPEQLYRDASSLGFDLKKYEQQGSLRVMFTSPQVFIDQLQEPGGEFDSVVAEHEIQRAMVDSINLISQAVSDSTKLRQVIYSFLNGIKRFGVTAIITQEDSTITGELSPTKFGLSYIVDTVIQLRYVEIKSEMHKALLVLKMRASNHDKSIREFEVTSNGIQIKLLFEDREGILRGSPTKSKAADLSFEMVKRLLKGD